MTFTLGTVGLVLFYVWMRFMAKNLLSEDVANIGVIRIGRKS